MPELVSEIRIALRALGRRRAVTLTVLLSLALGVGATTAVFSTLHAVLLRPLPYPAAEQLAILRPDFEAEEGFRPGQWAYPYYAALRATQDAFSHVAAYAPAAFNLGDIETPERVSGEYVSASYLPTLGIRPARGRAFLPDEDDAPAVERVVMLSHRLWRRLGEPEPAGLQLRIDGLAVQVIGILPAGFHGLTGDADVLVPMGMVAHLDAPTRLERPFNYWHYVVARARTDLVTAARSYPAIAARMSERVPLPDWLPGVRLALSHQTLEERRAGATTREAVLILSGAALLVLLIACANVVHLLLVRAFDRRREFALRAALGAGNGRLARHALVEAGVLGTAGAIAGLVVAVLLVAWLETGAAVLSGPGGTTWTRIVSADPRLDAPVLAFALITALCAALASAILPAVRSIRDLRTAIASGTRRFSASGALILVQTALAILLLVGGGLLLRSLHALMTVQTGFDDDRILTLEAQLPRARYGEERIPQFVEALLARIAAVPGVAGVSLDFAGPWSGWSTSRGFRIAGQPEPQGGAPGPQVRVHPVGAGHFGVLGTSIVQGREFTAADLNGTRRVVILGRGAAARFFPNGNAIGSSVWIGVWDEGETAEVIGIAEDPAYDARSAAAAAHAYLPHTQVAGERRLMLMVRAARDPAAIVAPVRAAVATIDAQLPFQRVMTMHERMAAAAGGERLLAGLLWIFGAAALILAGTGVYGVLAFSVARSRTELGVRIALGARTSHLLRVVGGRALAWAVAGALLGISASWPLSALLRNQLFGVGRHDPVVLAAAVLILTAVAAIACAHPVWTAARVPAREAMREG